MQFVNDTDNVNPYSVSVRFCGYQLLFLAYFAQMISFK